MTERNPHRLTRSLNPEGVELFLQTLCFVPISNKFAWLVARQVSENSPYILYKSD